MEVVAGFLTTTALSRSAGEGNDLFGRSAFNRYYYASFLVVRESLAEMNDAWKGLKHKAYPEVLTGQVVNRLKSGKRAAIRARDRELVRLCSAAIDAAKDLASVMQEGYAIRVVADYEPRSKVSFSGSADFSLNSISVAQAKKWAPKSKVLVGRISLAWRQLPDEQ